MFVHRGRDRRFGLSVEVARLANLMGHYRNILLGVEEARKRTELCGLDVEEEIRDAEGMQHCLIEMMGAGFSEV